MPYANIGNDLLVMISIVRDDLPTRPTSFESWSGRDQAIWNICSKYWEQNPTNWPGISSIICVLEVFQTSYKQGEANKYDFSDSSQYVREADVVNQENNYSRYQPCPADADSCPSPLGEETAGQHAVGFLVAIKGHLSRLNPIGHR